MSRGWTARQCNVLLPALGLMALASAHLAAARGTVTTQGVIQPASQCLQLGTKISPKGSTAQHMSASGGGEAGVPAGVPFGETPLTQAQLDELFDHIVVDNGTAYSEFMSDPPTLDYNGAPISLAVTIRVHSTKAQLRMREFLTIWMQAMSTVLLQPGLSSRVLFVNRFSSFHGAHANAAYQGVVEQYHLSELSAFDFTYSVGVPAGTLQAQAITLGLLYTIGQTVYNHLHAAKLNTQWGYPAVNAAWPKGYSNAQTIWWTQRMDLTVRLQGPALIPFIPERHTAANLAFRDAFVAANTTVRTQNVIAHTIVQRAATRRRLKGEPQEDIIDVTLRLILTPVDMYTPRQIMSVALKGPNFQEAAAKHGVPMAARLLAATTRTVQIEDDGTEKESITGIDELSGFVTKVGGDGPMGRVAAARALEGTASAAGSTILSSVEDGLAGISGGIIVGIVVGAVVIMALLASAGLIIAARRYRQGARSILTHGSSSSSSATWSDSLTPPQTSSARSSALTGLFKGSSSTAVLDDSVAPLATDISAEEITFCLDGEGQPVMLGQGSWGCIYLACRWGTQEVAVKVINREGHDSTWLALLRREVAMLQKVSFDRNIVQYYGACLEGDRAMLVMEYCAGGDLRRALLGDWAPELAWHRSGREVALDVARGLRYCHARGVIHRDLKSSNVLLTAEGVAKIGDVGLARLAGAAGDTSSLAVAGTFTFAAPEMLLGRKVTEKADAYSFGVLLWELATQEVPVRGQMREIKCPQEAPSELVELVKSCLSVNPDDRPSSQHIFDALKAMPQQVTKDGS